MIAARAALAAFASLALAPPAAAQASSPATLSIPDHAWYEMRRTDAGGERNYQAFANVRRAGALARFHQLSFTTGLAMVFAFELEADCGAHSLRLLAGGTAEGRTATLHPEDQEARPVVDDGLARAAIDLVCGPDSRWRAVADPMAEGAAFLSR